MSVATSKSHVLVRYDGDATRRENASLTDTFETTLNSLREYVDVVGDVEVLALLGSQLKGFAPFGRDLVGEALHEIDMREGSSGPNTPTLVCDPLLAHRLARVDSPAEREAYNDRLLDVLRRGAPVGLRFVIALSLNDPNEGKRAFEALSPAVRAQFRRISLSDVSLSSDEDVDKLARTMEEVTGVAWSEDPADHDHTDDCTCWDSMDCPDCGSARLLVSTFDQVRAEMSAYGARTANTLNDLMEQAGGSGRVITCPDCGTSAVVTGAVPAPEGRRP